MLVEVRDRLIVPPEAKQFAVKLCSAHPCALCCVFLFQSLMASCGAWVSRCQLLGLLLVPWRCMKQLDRLVAQIHFGRKHSLSFELWLRPRLQSGFWLYHKRRFDYYNMTCDNRKLNYNSKEIYCFGYEHSSRKAFPYSCNGVIRNILESSFPHSEHEFWSFYYFYLLNILPCNSVSYFACFKVIMVILNFFLLGTGFFETAY